MFEKIRLEKISYHIEGNTIVFSCPIHDEKQMLLASGRIHRHTTHGTGQWNTLGSFLTLSLPTSSLDKSLEKIKQLFNSMVS